MESYDPEETKEEEEEDCLNRVFVNLDRNLANGLEDGVLLFVKLGLNLADDRRYYGRWSTELLRKCSRR